MRELGIVNHERNWMTSRTASVYIYIYISDKESNSEITQLFTFRICEGSSSAERRAISARKTTRSFWSFLKLVVLSIAMSSGDVTEQCRRFCVLSWEQVQRLDSILGETVPVHGRGNFPTLSVQPRQIVQVNMKAHISLSQLSLHTTTFDYKVSFWGYKCYFMTYLFF